jgi:hypothetical protein
MTVYKSVEQAGKTVLRRRLKQRYKIREVTEAGDIARKRAKLVCLDTCCIGSYCRQVST